MAEDTAETTPGVPERGARRRRKTAAEPAAPACAMSIHAHPDDQEFTVGGTLAKWARSGCRVITVCITSGGAGSNQSTPLDMTREALVPIREEEQRRACQTRLIFPELLAEGLDPHHVKRVFIHGAPRPDAFVDISSTLDAKLAALREHKSQMGQWDPADMITAWAREQGKSRGLAAAEAYRLMVLEGP